MNNHEFYREDKDPDPRWSFLRRSIGVGVVALAAGLILPSSLNSSVPGVEHRGQNPNEKKVIVCDTSPDLPHTRIAVLESELPALVTVREVTTDLSQCSAE